MKVYFSLKELNPKNYPTTQEQLSNLKDLINKISIIREAYGKPMTVTSGLRSQADQARINPSASKSKHLLGAAVDISDPNGDLKDWLKSNIKLLEQTGLYCEHFDHTPTWVHLQILPPKSGKRFFIP